MPKLHPLSGDPRPANLVLQSGRVKDQSVPGDPGILVNERSKQQIREALRREYRGNTHIVVRVFDDSADQWYIVRDQMVAAGFKYQLIPTRTPPVLTAEQRARLQQQREQRLAENRGQSGGQSGGAGGGSTGGVGTGTGSSSGSGRSCCSGGRCSVCNPPTPPGGGRPGGSGSGGAVLVQ